LARRSGGKLGQANQVRIIGGLHRGRKLSFPDLPGLRPSADRVRETLFNWLQERLPGASCLDLFAGSGILGLESVSRGAEYVLMLDRSAEVVTRIRSNAELLGLKGVQVEQVDSLKWLDQRPTQPFDIVFVDPPFADDLMADCCQRLAAGGWLKPNARIYLETDARFGLPRLPTDWEQRKEQQAGRVAFYLYSNSAD
jgi:16S rRNA (guanine966-N2)-methyltransferase